MAFAMQLRSLVTSSTHPGPDDVARYNRPAAVVAMILATNPGSFTMTAAPFLVGAFVRGGMMPSEASMLTAGELAGMTVASLLVALLVRRFDRRLLITCGLGVALLGHIATILLSGFAAILIARVVAGFGIGVMYTTAVAALGGLIAPERAFGLSATTNQVATTILMVILAQLGLKAGVVVTVVTIAALSALMGLTIPLVPRRAPSTSQTPSGSDASAGWLTPLLATFGLLFFMTSLGIVWPLVGQIGLDRHVSSPVVNNTLASAGVAAIIGGLTAGIIGLRFGRWPVLLLCATCLSGSMLILHSHFSTNAFRAAVLVILFFTPFSIPYLLGTLAALDRSGRWVALSGAMLPCGMSLGGLIAAIVVATGGLPQVGLAGALVIVLSISLILASLRIGRGGRGGEHLGPSNRQLTDNAEDLGPCAKA